MYRPLCIYLCPCRKGRQIGSSRSGPAVTAKPLWWTAGAAGWTGPRLQWGSWASRGWCAGPHRTTSACSPSACHKGQRWRRPLSNTENRLTWGGKRRDGVFRDRGSQMEEEGGKKRGKHISEIVFKALCNNLTNDGEVKREQIRERGRERHAS